jgi:heme/copper-type cytochrome/quinol oxidase subunit 2
MNRVPSSLIAAAIFVAFATSAAAQQKPAAGKTHRLAATLETVQWGWLDPKEPPKLTVNSGDIVSIETMMHAHDKVQPGMTIEQAVELRKLNPGGGPHSVTGPIFVSGAEPGDVMEIRILKIVPKPFGVNFNLPGKDFPTIGALASEMPEGSIRWFKLDVAKKQAQFKPGIVLDLQPFPGTLAVGIDPDDPAGQDDIVIEAGELHLPIGKPVKMLLRSIDVLHDFYVPEFRAKMDMVPGMVTYFWFTPTRTGTYEVLCAELCGTGHSYMRGTVIVDTEEDYLAWLQTQSTFAELTDAQQVAEEAGR